MSQIIINKKWIGCLSLCLMAIATSVIHSNPIEAKPEGQSNTPSQTTPSTTNQDELYTLIEQISRQD